MARKTKEQKRIETLEQALRDLLDATRAYMYCPADVRRQAVTALHRK